MKHTRLDITNINEALKRAQPDAKAGISITMLTGNADFALYAAELAPGKFVNAHYHNRGMEIYFIIKGEGIIYTGMMKSDEKLKWNKPLPVKSGACFTIPEGEIHQLKNTSGEKLTFIFACPQSHLKQDRFLVDGIAQ